MKLFYSCTIWTIEYRCLYRTLCSSKDKTISCLSEYLQFEQRNIHGYNNIFQWQIGFLSQYSNHTHHTLCWVFLRCVYTTNLSNESWSWTAAVHWFDVVLPGTLGLDLASSRFEAKYWPLFVRSIYCTGDMLLTIDLTTKVLPDLRG